ncbi:hypothetical protein ACC759_37040, partial [Rhizobium ruizarguesonis]
MAVEVSIGTLRRAEVPMHIDAEARLAGIGEQSRVARGAWFVEIAHGPTLCLQAGFDKEFEGAGTVEKALQDAGATKPEQRRARFI